ncbi:MAG: hypothetical protein NZT92_15945 [Abditibacteriales bacterium]|nr:hypothetical protein [Abditibacteriales bacterium]MDW8365731.1 hypothetical protein [Abditibacteriales bacterium]
MILGILEALSARLAPSAVSSLPSLPASRASDVPPLTGWRVVGVIITEERQAAWLEAASGERVWVEVGATIAGGQKVVAITPSEVRVRGEEGQEVVLRSAAAPGHRLPAEARGEAQETPLEERVRGRQ